MRDLLKPLLLVLAVPVLATTFSMLARSEWEARWSASLVHQLAMFRMRPDQRLLARFSLPSMCGDPRTAVKMRPWCGTYTWHSQVIQLSAGTAGAGFLFLGALLLAGGLVRGSRRRLVLLFRPFLWFASAGTALVCLANAALAVAALVALSLYWLGRPVQRVSIELLLVAGTAAAVWGIGMLAAAASVTRRPTITLVGRRLDAAAQPALFEEVRRLAEATGAAPPSHIVASLVPSLFVTELNVSCLDGTLSGRTLCVSLPLLRILSVSEFRALVAHELAHVAGEGGEYARRVAPSYTGAVRAMEQLGRRAHGLRAVAVVPPLALLRFFFQGIGQAAEPIAAREHDADRAAAETAGREGLGSALAKTQAFAPAWYTVAGAMFDAVAAGTQYVNASRLFQEVAASNAGRERLLGIGQQRHPHPTDRHPTLAERLNALGLDPAAVADAALVTEPAQPAVALIAGYEGIEEGLSAAEHQLIAATGGEVPLPA